MKRALFYIIVSLFVANIHLSANVVVDDQINISDAGDEVFVIYQEELNVLEVRSGKDSSLLSFFVLNEGFVITQTISNPRQPQLMLILENDYQYYLMGWNWSEDRIVFTQLLSSIPEIYTFSMDGLYFIFDDAINNVFNIELINTVTGKKAYTISNISSFTEYAYLGKSNKTLMLYQSNGYLRYYSVQQNKLVAETETETDLTVVSVIASAKQDTLLAYNDNDLLIIDRLTGFVKDYKTLPTKLRNTDQRLYKNNHRIGFMSESNNQFEIWYQEYNAISFTNNHTLSFSLAAGEIKPPFIFYEDSIIYYDSIRNLYFQYEFIRKENVSLTPRWQMDNGIFDNKVG